MICQSCHGQRVINLSTDDGMPLHEIPCPDCHGGIQHCCEGDREQPSVADNVFFGVRFMSPQKVKRLKAGYLSGC